MLLLGLASAVACARPVSHSVDAAAHGDWGYEAHNGPARWADLSDAFRMCREGTEQSPVDLHSVQPAKHSTLSFEYPPASLRIARHEHVIDVIDNGHTIQVDYDEGGTLESGGRSYHLVQYHFHAPSEHTRRGRHFPMEMHLVHRDPTGEFAVLGVWIEEGAHNPAFEPVWDHMPREVGEVVHLEHVRVDVDRLLPRRRETYRYRGSLTTPPCTEGVQWLIAVEPVVLSAQQIQTFRSIFDGNNRPVQSSGGRAITVDEIAD